MATQTGVINRNGVGGMLLAEPRTRVTKVRAVGQRLITDRANAIAELDALFASGVTPKLSLHGRFRGELIGLTREAPLDPVFSFITKHWMPWQGKMINSRQGGGINYLRRSSKWLAGICWPSYHQYHSDTSETYRAFEFRTSIGPGLFDPELQVYKLDYDLPQNPRFVVRSVLGELMQVEDGYYLGKFHLHWLGKWRTVGYFALLF